MRPALEKQWIAVCAVLALVVGACGCVGFGGASRRGARYPNLGETGRVWFVQGTGGGLHWGDIQLRSSLRKAGSPMKVVFHHWHKDRLPGQVVLTDDDYRLVKRAARQLVAMIADFKRDVPEGEVYVVLRRRPERGLRGRPPGACATARGLLRAERGDAPAIGLSERAIGRCAGPRRGEAVLHQQPARSPAVGRDGLRRHDRSQARVGGGLRRIPRAPGIRRRRQASLPREARGGAMETGHDLGWMAGGSRVAAGTGIHGQARRRDAGRRLPAVGTAVPGE